MATLIFVGKDGRRFEISARTGQSIMEAATANLVPGIIGDCGGCVSCGTCEAIIEAPWDEKLPARQADEIALLGDDLARRPTTRLTCQIQVSTELDGIVIQLP